MKYCYILKNPRTKQSKRITKHEAYKLLKQAKLSEKEITEILNKTSKGKPIPLNEFLLYKTKNKFYYKEIKK